MGPPRTVSMSDPAERLAIAVAQLDPLPGDVAGNLALALRTVETARDVGADLVVFPALFLSGGAPGLPAACRAAVETLAAATREGPALLVGTPWTEDGRLHDSAVLLADGAVAAVRHRVEVPPGGPFAPGPMPGPVAFRGVRLGVAVGGDLRSADVCECLAETGADLLVVPAAMPYSRTAHAAIENAAVARVVESGLPLLFVNGVGGRGEDVLDGGSFALNADRFLALQFPAFLPRVRLSQWELAANGWKCLGPNMADRTTGAQADYCALMLGVRDFVRARGHKSAIVQLDGGTDTALVAALAVDALGSAQVRAVSFDAPHAAAGLVAQVLPAAPVAAAMEAALGGAAENLRSHGEAALLAALAEHCRATLLCAVNLSQALAGRHAPGDFNPLRHLPAREVRALAALRNGWRPPDGKGPDGVVIPEPGQPCDAGFDAILAQFDAGLPAGALDPAEVARIESLRAQAAARLARAAPGVRLSPAGAGD